MADIFQKHQAVGIVLNDNVVKFDRACQAAHHAYRNLKSLLRIGRRLAKLAGRYFDVLLDHRADYVRRGQPAGRKLQRIEPHAHRVLALAEDCYIAYTRHALERILYVKNKVVGDEIVGGYVVSRKDTGSTNKNVV